MIKLIATDMDGTLLNSDHEIGNEFWSIFEKLKEKGIAFSAASGRQYYNLLDKFDSIKEDVIFIAENGAYVVKNGKELFSQNLKKEIIPEFVETARQIDQVYTVLCGKKSAYIESNYKEFVTEVEKYYSKYEIVEDLTKVNDDILKVALYDFKGSEKNCYTYFKKYNNEFKVVVSAEHWVDIMDKETNKGVAIQRVQESLGISRTETMAFGDYLNDLEMLENCEHSYAMDNAHPKLKEISKFIAGSNDDHAVIKVIKDTLLI